MGKWKSKRRTKESEMRWGKIFRVVGDESSLLDMMKLKRKSFQAKTSTGHLTL